MNKCILEAFEQKKEVLEWIVSKKNGPSKSNVNRAKERLNPQTFKKRKQPEESPEQEASIRPKVKKLRDRMLGGNSNCIIMEDVRFSFKSSPGPQYNTMRKGQVSNQSKSFTQVQKFGKETMVW